MIEKFNLTEQELQQNYQEFIDFVSNVFSGERKENLLKMYSTDDGCLGISLCSSPASLNENYHLSYPGGYLQHIMNVVKTSFAVKKLFQISECNIDFTDEEMVFAALHHDLGKLGDSEFGDNYVPQDEEWKAKKGEVYKINPSLPFMDVSDRAVYTLQKYGVKYTWKEFLGIKLADGMYNQPNDRYLKQFNLDFILKTNLPKVIHLADYISCCGEKDRWKNQN